MRKNIWSIFLATQKQESLRITHGMASSIVIEHGAVDNIVQELDRLTDLTFESEPEIPTDPVEALIKFHKDSGYLQLNIDNLEEALAKKKAMEE